MTTVKADGEVAPYEDMENATLLQKECYDLDEDTMIEITTYEKKYSFICKIFMEN